MFMARALNLSWQIGWRWLPGRLKLGKMTVSRNFSSHFRKAATQGSLQYSLTSKIGCWHTPHFPWGKSLPVNPLLLSAFKLSPPARSIVRVSKNKGKLKTVKSVAKRFHRTGSGKLKYWPAGKVHNMLAKSNKRRRQLRKPRYASKTQLKTLNKMISGW